MYTQRQVLRWFAIGWLALGTIASESRGQLLVAPATGPTIDGFAVGATLARPNTLQVASMDELIARVAGGISDKAFRGHAFASYWDASASAKSGKAFEAITAWAENVRLARGSPMRLVVTAAEGRTQHPADVLLRGEKGRIVRQFQFKLSREAAIRAAADPKYAGMTIVIPADEMESMGKELFKQQVKAKQRGVLLSPKWQAVEQAVEKGRITSRLPSGATTSTREGIVQAAKQQTRQAWQQMAKAAAKGAGSTAASTAERSGASALGRAAGCTMVVVSVGTMGYYTYKDAMRYRRGEIGPVYLGVKGSMRGAQTGLIGYLVFAPDPSQTTKLVAGGAIIVLLVADSTSEYIYGAQRQQARRQLLETIDRDERFHAARKQLREQAVSELIGLEVTAW